MSMDDRALVWTLLAYGLESAPALRRDILGQQDTRDLFLWRTQATQLIEEVTEILDGRDGDDHYPERGMQP